MSWYDSAAKTGKNIAVWWDMKDCPVPEGIDAHRVRPSIEGALKEQGYSGPVSITAYGDQKQTPDCLLRALSSTGVAVVHIRSESTCAVMYKDMVKWREDNPPPATMMIITNQMLDVFHWDLARLQQRTSYDLFLAYSVEPRAQLFVYTLETWLWKKLLLGTTASVTSSSSDAIVFYCKSCSLECLSLKSFKKHLSTEKHAKQEVLHPQPKQLNSVTSKWGKNYAATPEYATAKIHVWWDMFDCPIPDGYDAHRVRPSLEGAFKELGYSGPVSITAFGDYKKTPKRHLHALSSTGIDVVHVIPEIIYSRMRDDIFKWRNDNPTPATMMIISDEAKYVFGTSLAQAQQEVNKYNLFWAYSFRPREMSVMVTSAEWLWDSLLADCASRSADSASISANCWINSSNTSRVENISLKINQEEFITDCRQHNKNLGLFWLEAKRTFPREQAVEEICLGEVVTEEVISESNTIDLSLFFLF
ncbi:zinc finger protein-related [Raphanus sativus]|nr:zinc finger protein-related [Raphanus sativus]